MQHTNKAQQGQSFIDMVFQETGGFEGIVEAAVLNGKSITDTIDIGETILVGAVTNHRIKSLLQRRRPATAINQMQEAINQPKGIRYWTIGIDFIIS